MKISRYTVHVYLAPYQEYIICTTALLTAYTFATLYIQMHEA